MIEEKIIMVDFISYLDQSGQALDDFISQLRKEDQGEEKVTAFRVFLATGLKSKLSQTKESADDTSLNWEWGKKFINRLLKKSTVQERAMYLEDQGVFSNLKEKSAPSKVKQDLADGTDILKTQLNKLTEWLDSKAR